jgi:hypothetical protein
VIADGDRITVIPVNRNSAAAVASNGNRVAARAGNRNTTPSHRGSTREREQRKAKGSGSEYVDTHIDHLHLEKGFLEPPCSRCRQQHRLEPEQDSSTGRRSDNCRRQRMGYSAARVLTLSATKQVFPLTKELDLINAARRRSHRIACHVARQRH